MNNAFFRTDFNFEIGFGHINRCLSLANILKKLYKCHFVFTKTPSNLINNHSDIKNFIIHDFYSEDKRCDEIVFFKNNAKNGDILIFDSYFFDNNYLLQLSKKGVKTISINDLPENCLNTDIIINYTLGIKKEQFKIKNNTQLLLGLDYLLLRKEFLDYLPFNNNINSEKIFVCLGATDNIEIINKIISYIKILAPNSNCSILVGNNEMQEKLNSLSYKNIDVFFDLKPNQVIQLISNASIAIVSSSTIALECMAIGVNLMTGYYVDNQKYLAQNIQTYEMGVNMGNLYDLSLENFKQSYLTLQKFDYKGKQLKDFPKNQKINYLNVFKKLKNE